MSVVILNESSSKTPMEKESVLLWAAILIAKKTYISGILGIPLDFDRSFDLGDEVKKVSAAERVFPLMANPLKNPRLKDVESHFDKNYSRLKLLRKKRKKNKSELIEIIKREDILRKHFNLTKDFFRKVRVFNHIDDLSRFTGDEENDLVTVHCLNTDYSDEEFTGYPVVPLTESFLSDDEFHLFNEAAEGLIAEKSNGLPYFKAFKFIDLPAVTELKENQIFMLIEKLESVKLSIEERLIRVQEILKTVSYESDNENRLADIISENILKDKDFFESTIADSIYESTDFTKKDGVNELYLCVCSYENMIDLYKHLNVYKDEVLYSYVKENISKNIELRMSRLFLYLKTE